MGYQIQITVKTPVCLAKNKRVGNVIETIDFIPGSTIRGALAVYYLKTNGTWNNEKRLYILPEEKTGEFNDLFHSDTLCFNNAYIRGAKVIPLTASSCKYQSGFSDSTGRKKQHGVRDALVELIKYELTGNFYKETFDVCSYKTEDVHKTCKAPMDRFSGYYTNDSVTYEKVLVSKRFIARTAINEFFETASPAQLYTLEVINEGQEFTTEINAEQFVRLSPHFNDITLRIGLGKSRGLGEVEMKIRRTTEPEGHQIRHRLEQLNNEMIKFAYNKYFFSITLHSDAILLDEILRFKTAMETKDLIDSEDITPEERNVLNEFKLLRGFLATHIISGWNYALRLPQEDSLSISKGSVFLFMSNILPESAKEILVTILEKVERCGIGEQKNKGFGRIRICDEFHWEVPLK